MVNKFSSTSSDSVKEETDGGGTKETTTKEQSTKSNRAESHRKEAVLAIDIQYYTLAKKTMQKVMATYISIVDDFVVKNKDKIQNQREAMVEVDSVVSSMY